MTSIAIVLTTFSALAGLIWTSRHLLIRRENRNGFTLTGDYPGPSGEPPSISVVVAAKDEQENIETCVRTMLDQDYGRFDMLVANDRSTDATAGIVQRIADEDRRLRLLNIEKLPEGWAGKNNAMQTGIASTSGEWICMIDADCCQTSTRTLSAAMRYALDQQADMLSVLPQLEMKGFWENVIQPVCGGVMMIWFHPDKVNDPAKPNAYANGAFMLIKRTAYQAIGTHVALKGYLNEDMHMARLVKEKGLRLRVVRGPTLYRVRMYTSLKQILRGWGRIFYGTFGTLKRLSLSMAVMLLVSLLPWVTAAVGLSLAAVGGQAATAWGVAGLIGLAAAAMQISVIYRFYRIVGAKQSLCWTYPLGCVMAVAALCISLSRLRKGASVHWRGTAYTGTSQT